MVKLAVCDDEQKDLEALISCIEDYSIIRRTDIAYETFTSYVDLESRIGEFDIFFIDYAMPDIDGMMFARTIRRLYNGAKTLIFVSRHEKIVFEAFSVQAHRFLCKPVDREKLFEALDAYFQTGQAAVKSLVVRNNRVTSIVDLKDILFIEAAGKETYIHTQSEQIVCRRTITSLEDELRIHGFFRVHRSFLVNLHSVKKYDAHTVEFVSGQKVSVGSRRYGAFVQAYQRLR